MDLIREIADLEKEIFSDPWTEHVLQGTLQYAAYHIRVLLMDGTIKRLQNAGIQDTEAGEIAGYSIYTELVDEGELCRIAIRPAMRGRGLSKRLMDEMLETISGNIFLEVRAKNEVARKLYESYGFQEVGVRKNYYEAPKDDAILMTFDRKVPEIEEEKE